MRNDDQAEVMTPTELSSSQKPAAGFVSRGGELHLSNPGQLELLRGMMERGVPLRTMARGFSMHPFIRDEDVLTIAPMAGRTPRTGEIVAFSLPGTGRLAIHRIIGHTGSGWLLRGDNCPEEDGMVTADDIIGRVIRVERNGRDVRLGLKRGWVLIAALNRGNGLTRLKRIWNAPRRAAGFILRTMQSLSLYRSVGRRLVPPGLISVADERDMETVNRLLNPLAPDLRQLSNPNVTNWVAKQGGKIIGFVQLVHHPEELNPWAGYWLFSLHVRSSYRGTGIGERLTRAVAEEALKKGAAELLLVVYEDNKRAVRLYEKLGFSRIARPELEPLLASEKENGGRRRMVMKKKLG